MELLFVNATLLTPHRAIGDGWLHVREGRIEDMGSGPPPALRAGRVDLAGGKLCPGFIELHIHGRNGVSVMDMAEDPGALSRLSEGLPATGVTAFIPTTLSAAMDRTRRVLAALADALDQPSWPGAVPAGIYSEGIFFSPVRCGAQNPAHLMPPSPEAVEELLTAGRGRIRVAALAPELPGAPEAVRRLRSAGVIASMAHTDAEYEQVEAAISAGLSHVTHLFNAMRPMHHLALGAAGAALCRDELTAEIIADGLHLLPHIVELAFRCKGPGNIILITDSVRFAGCDDGEYDWSGVRVRKTGPKLEVVRDGPFSLAGSCLTLDAALRNALLFTGRPVTDILPCLTANPARVLGLSRKGALAPGMDADLTVLDGDNRVRAVYVAGRKVYEAPDNR